MNLVYENKNTNTYKTVRDVLKKHFMISSRLLTFLRKEKKIYLNNSYVYLDKEIQPNDIIIVNLDFNEDNSNIVPFNMKLDIIYEDDSYLVVDKPSRNCYTSFLFTLW